MNNYKTILLLILISCVSGVYSQEFELPEGGVDVFSKEQMKTFADKQKSIELFFDATKAKVTNRANKAEELFSECVIEDKNNDAAWYELSLIFYKKGQIDKAISAAKKALDLFPTNKWYNIRLADYYIINLNFEEAINIYENLCKIEPYNIEFQYDLAALWIKFDKLDKAINIYNNIEKKYGINENTTMKKVELYKSIDNIKKSIIEVEKLLETTPYNAQYLSILAELYILQNDTDNAFKIYNKIKEIDPNNAFINITLADYYRNKGDFKKAIELLKEGFSNASLDSDTKIQLLMTFYSQAKNNNQNSKDFEELADIVYKVHKTDVKAIILKAELYFISNKFVEAQQLFKEAIKLDPNNYNVWETLLRIDASLNDTSNLLINSKEATETFPNQPLPYYFYGSSLMLKKDYEKAIKAFKTGDKLVIKDDDLRSDFNALIADCYQVLKDFENSFNYYELTLKYNSNNATALNNYAYYLSLQSKELEKAEKMAEKAVALNPDSPIFIDTYAWVYYKMKEYKKAESLMDLAIKKLEKPNAVYYEHYGDIKYQLGETEKALEYWKKAKEMLTEPNQELDNKILNKKIDKF